MLPSEMVHYRDMLVIAGQDEDTLRNRDARS